MGPLADTVFLKALHLATDASCDRDYIPVIYDGNCLRADRSDFITAKSGLSPYESLKSSLSFLENCGASVIAIPCNTAHFWIDELRSVASDQTVLLDMPASASDLCRRKGVRRVGLMATLGTYKSGIYRRALEANGIICVEPCTRSKELISAMIRKTKGGECAVFDDVENELLSEDCDAIITGCTELSYILWNLSSTKAARYIDPLSALALSAVSACGKVAREIPFT
jgi:aspartate racemase